MKPTKGEQLFYFLNESILLLAALSCLFPLLHVIALAFSDFDAVMSGLVTLWPRGWSTEAFRLLLEGGRVPRALLNNVIITVVGLVLSLVFTTAAAYPLARKRFYARRFFTLAFVFTMLFNGGLIPTYLVVNSLDLLNSYWALWLPGLISTFNMLIIRTFFLSLPDELFDSAEIDGCGELRTLFHIVLPLSIPVFATIALFYGVGYWNNFVSVLIYINKTEMQNLTLLVQQMIQSQSILEGLNNAPDAGQTPMTPESIRAAGILVLVAPMLVVYPFLQKYFVKGVMIGSIKG
ncbi:carbohydrate ABC transporter permease [Paenibacillus agaridevorans]|uniref:Carbohydrate ABC transporter permease n=1 Tax=Paenibacillus agaridevorans TaxID=171404 RepID=A0A2R5F061_9BACL|nr:carbohydrate ABC transporter permease [Paenibacillus agaridevorans]GBG11299.1 carbohydrate ABC transporter permease [Paenibacillus agaridevorans]